MSPYREPGRRSHGKREEAATWPAVLVVLVACPLLVMIGRASRWGLGAVLLVFVGTLVVALLRRA